MSSNGRKRPKKSLTSKEAGLASEETPDNKHGLINTLSNSKKQRSSKKAASNPSNLISVSRMSSGNYDKIVESDDESDSSMGTDSDWSGTSSERARKKEMKQSNVFLLKVINGRVPSDLLNSRITRTDRENLSTLIPHLINQSNG